jgi:HAD domain in Swiss Army Knife RNA repair proteins
MKVIFLDIDGVINTGKVREKLQFLDSYMGTFFDPNDIIFDSEAVSYLKNIVDESKAKIVISSSRKLQGMDYLKNLWIENNLPGEIIDLTKDLKHLKRSDEISEWLSRNGVESYVIFDDVFDMDIEHSLNFIKCKSYYGITKEQSEKAIKILKNNK